MTDPIDITEEAVRAGCGILEIYLDRRGAGIAEYPERTRRPKLAPKLHATDERRRLLSHARHLIRRGMDSQDPVEVALYYGEARGVLLCLGRLSLDQLDDTMTPRGGAGGDLD